MRQYRPTTGAYCLVLLLVSLLVFVVVGDDQGQEQEQGMINNKEMDGVIKSPSKWKLLSSQPSLTMAAYWEGFKNKYSALLTAPLSFLSPAQPNPDFRVKLAGEDEEQGTTETTSVKGAVGKSMEKTMETIDESAKSAAKMATGTKDMLKNTISHNTPMIHPEDEL